MSFGTYPQMTLPIASNKIASDGEWQHTKLEFQLGVEYYGNGKGGQITETPSSLTIKLIIINQRPYSRQNSTKAHFQSHNEQSCANT